MTQIDLDRARAYIEQLFDYQFEDIGIFREALCDIHYLREGQRTPNEDLAFIGRKVLNLVLSTDAYNAGTLKSARTIM